MYILEKKINNKSDKYLTLLTIKTSDKGTFSNFIRANILD